MRKEASPASLSFSDSLRLAFLLDSSRDTASKAPPPSRPRGLAEGWRGCCKRWAGCCKREMVRVEKKRNKRCLISKDNRNGNPYLFHYLQARVGEHESERLDGLDVVWVITDDSCPRTTTNLLKLSCEKDVKCIYTKSLKCIITYIKYDFRCIFFHIFRPPHVTHLQRKSPAGLLGRRRIGLPSSV